MPNQLPVTALFLDVGGVLLTNGWDRHARIRAAQKFGLDKDELAERHNLTFDTYELGKISLDTYLKRVVFHIRRDFTPEDFKQFMLEQSQPYPQMIELVCRLKQKYRLKIGVVSNEGREITVYRIKKFRLAEFVDFFICSAFVNYRKPDPDIFRVALDVAQAQPEDVVYIEDRQMFVEVAKTLGIRGLHHLDYATTRKALAEMGLSLEEHHGRK